MLAHQILGALGVACFKGVDDVHVIADRAFDPVVLADRAAADHAHMGEQVLRQPDQHLVAAELDDGLVEGDIDLGILVELGMQLVALEGREHAPQAGDIGVAGGLGDQARRHAFQGGPGLDQLDHLALGLAYDIDAAAGHRTHEAFALELHHRFAHRRARDAEILRELALVEPDVGARAIDIRRDNEVAQGGVRLVLERLPTVDRGDHQARFAHGNGLFPRCHRPPPAGYIINNATADHRPLVRRDILLRRHGSARVTPQDRRPAPRPGVRPGDDRCRP